MPLSISGSKSAHSSFSQNLTTAERFRKPKDTLAGKLLLVLPPRIAGAQWRSGRLSQQFQGICEVLDGCGDVLKAQAADCKFGVPAR